MIAQFALRLLLGISLAWAVLPRRAITSGFFRIQCLLALALGVLAAVTADGLFPSDGAETAARPEGQGPSESIGLWAAAACGLLAGLAFAGSVAWTLERRRGGTAFLFAILSGSFAVLAASVLPAARTATDGALRVASELAAAGVLGSCVTGMLLGHWYLTAPTMSIAPLGRANAWLAATLAARMALSAIGWHLASGDLTGSTHAVWLALRWIAGIVLPLVLSAMIWRILRYRNTQAATGVLFAAVILVFLGELAGALLSREVGRPL